MNFLDPSMAPMILQGLALTFSQMTTPATPVTPAAAAAPAAPAATASVTLPQPAAAPAPVERAGPSGRDRGRRACRRGPGFRD